MAPQSDSQPMELFPFRYRDPLTGKWVRARYLAERHEIAARYEEWEIVGPPEVRNEAGYGHFQPYRDRARPSSCNVVRVPALDSDEQYLALLFLRRYVTFCARRRRYAQMEGAARLAKQIATEARAGRARVGI